MIILQEEVKELLNKQTERRKKKVHYTLCPVHPGVSIQGFIKLIQGAWKWVKFRICKKSMMCFFFKDISSDGEIKTEITIMQINEKL